MRHVSVDKSTSKSYACEMVEQNPSVIVKIIDRLLNRIDGPSHT